MSVAELSAGIGAVLGRSFPDEVWVRGEIANISRPTSGHVYFDLVGDGCALGGDAVGVGQAGCQRRAPPSRRRGSHDRRHRRTHPRPRVLVFRTRARLVAHALDRHLLHTGPAGRGPRGAAAHARGRRSAATASTSRGASRTAARRSRHERRKRSRARLPANARGKRTRMAGDRLRHQSPGRGRGRVDRGRAGSGMYVRAAPRRRLPRPRRWCPHRPRGVRSRARVARAIAMADSVVWTGIGHEIDTTVADAVAHRQFRTPTACAMALVEQVTRWCEYLDGLWAAITRATTAHLRTRAATLDSCEQRLAQLPDRALGRATRAIDSAESRVRALDPARTWRGDGRSPATARVSSFAPQPAPRPVPSWSPPCPTARSRAPCMADDDISGVVHG